jgi:uncharacterized protein (TIGR03067 family)
VRLLVLALCLFSLAVPLAAQKPEPSDDERQIQGNWQIVELKTGAGDVPELVRKIVYRFGAKQQFVLELPSELGTEPRIVKYTLNPDKNPREIDLEEEGKGIVKGIYKLEKDQLTL